MYNPENPKTPDSASQELMGRFRQAYDAYDTALEESLDLTFGTAPEGDRPEEVAATKLELHERVEKLRAAACELAEEAYGERAHAVLEKYGLGYAPKESLTRWKKVYAEMSSGELNKMAEAAYAAMQEMREAIGDGPCNLIDAYEAAVFAEDEARMVLEYRQHGGVSMLVNRFTPRASNPEEIEAYKQACENHRRD